jgi:hypothetical protein
MACARSRRPGHRCTRDLREGELPWRPSASLSRRCRVPGRVSRAVSPRRCVSAVMRVGSGVDMRFGAGFGGYSWDAGNKPRPSAGPSPRPALAEVARQPVRPLLSCTTACRNARPSLARQAFQPDLRRPSHVRGTPHLLGKHGPGHPTRTTIEEEPAWRSYAQREAAGH